MRVRTEVEKAQTEAVKADEAGWIAGMKKGDMVEAAELPVEGKGWLPAVLRVAPPEAEGGDGADAPVTEDGYSFAAE